VANIRLSVLAGGEFGLPSTGKRRIVTPGASGMTVLGQLLGGFGQSGYGWLRQNVGGVGAAGGLLQSMFQMGVTAEYGRGNAGPWELPQKGGGGIIGKALWESVRAAIAATKGITDTRGQFGGSLARQTFGGGQTVQDRQLKAQEKIAENTRETKEAITKLKGADLRFSA
jgi:hypothetical protein